MGGVSKANDEENSWGAPGAYAIARNQAGGDWAAGVLLFRVKYHFQEGKKRLQRFGKEWVAMSRSDWASQSGLSESEMKNKALPKLRERQFVEVRQMKLKAGGPKLIWISLDLASLHEWTDEPALAKAILSGAAGIGYPKPKAQNAYPYKVPK